MSADNGWIIQMNDSGEYTLQMFFASDEDYPDANEATEKFSTIQEAVLGYDQLKKDPEFVCEYGLHISITPPGEEVKF